MWVAWLMGYPKPWVSCAPLATPLCPADAGAQVQPFAEAWDAVNGRRAGCSWASSPWVWVLEFRRVEA